MASITFSTCFYIFKAKFDVHIYLNWMHNMLSNVCQYNLVVYTDDIGSKYINPYLNNARVKMIILPYEQFYMYKYKEYWVTNHAKNDLLKHKVDWRVNMLWSEKIFFVKNKQLVFAKPRSVLAGVRAAARLTRAVRIPC